MIAAGSVFVFLLLVYVVLAAERAKANRRKQQALDKAYSDKNLAKMEYSDAPCNEETDKILSRKASGQLTIEDLVAPDKPSSESQKSDEVVFGKIGTERVEEITGNFKGK